MGNNQNGCNGWNNYNTWVVKVWMDNTEPVYKKFAALVKKYRGQDDAAARLGDDIREWLENNAPQMVNGCGLYGQLLRGALADVEVYAIARVLLDE